jgi:hypothetical protein
VARLPFSSLLIQRAAIGAKGQVVLYMNTGDIPRSIRGINQVMRP